MFSDERMGDELLAIVKNKDRASIFQNLTEYFNNPQNKPKQIYLDEAVLTLKRRLLRQRNVELLLANGADEYFDNIFIHKRNYFNFGDSHRGLYRKKCSKWCAHDRVVEKYVLKALGDPHKKLPPVIQVTGSNGKGSVASYVTSILAAHGKKVHMFQSPTVVNINDTINIGGQRLTDEQYIYYCQRSIEAYYSILNDPDFIKEFEQADQQDLAHGKDINSSTYDGVLYWSLFTPAVMLAFAESEADYTVTEVIVGGMNDFTNIFTKDDIIATVITNIEYGTGSNDGTMPIYDENNKPHYSLKANAYHKSMLGKEGVPMIVANQSEEALEEIRRVATEILGTQTIEYGREWKLAQDTNRNFVLMYYDEKIIMPLNSRLIGEFQPVNIATALSCLLKLEENGIINLQTDLIKQGIENCQEVGRPQKVLNSYLNEYFGDDVEIVAGVIKLNTAGIKPFEDVLAASPEYTNYFAYTAAGQVKRKGSYVVPFFKKYFKNGKRLVTYKFAEMYEAGLEAAQELLRAHNLNFEAKENFASAMEYIKAQIEQQREKEPDAKIRVFVTCESMVNFDKRIYYFTLPREGENYQE